MSKYSPLFHFLSGRFDRSLPMSFREIEAILGLPLPRSAIVYPAWWANEAHGPVQKAAWRKAQYRTSRVDLEGRKVVFTRNMPTGADAR